MKKLLSFFIAIIAAFCFNFISNTIIKTESNRVEAAQVKQVQAAHILVPTEEEALKIREEIIQESNQSNLFYNFREAAKKYSKCPSNSSGGILGWFGRGDMVKEFEDASFDLKPGEISQPVKTAYGYHLIYVISKK